MPRMLLLPLLAVLGGAAGHALRCWELSAAFDAEGLAIAGAPSTWLLILLSVLLAAAFALLCRGGKEADEEHGAFAAARNNPAYLAICALSALCLLLAAAFGLKEELSAPPPSFLRVLLWLMCILSALCVAHTSLQNYRGQVQKLSLAALAPAYTFCLWLVAAHQIWATDPVILDYAYRLLAIVCVMLALYFTAAFSFDKGKVWPCAFFCLMGIYFSMVALAGSPALTECLLYLFSIAYLLAAVVTLLRRPFSNTRYQPKHLQK